MKIIVFIILLALLISCVVADNTTSNEMESIRSGTYGIRKGVAVGGGSKYSDIITYDPNDKNHILVNSNSASNLRSILKDTINVDKVIFLNPNLEINLTNEIELPDGSISIVEGITLASKRDGMTNSGAKIIIDSYPQNVNAVFSITEERVRISGINFRGPYETQGPDGNGQYGILTSGVDSFRVDNCEIHDWFVAVGLANGSGSNVEIHNNYIHDNITDWGYGVLLGSNANAKIYGNKFFHNRHDIAGSGVGTCSYEAYDNLVLAGGTSHNFDMHGAFERENNTDENAGYYINIHHNEFKEIRLNRNIVIRAKPTIGCYVEYNKFAAPNEEDAIIQYNFYGNLYIGDNELSGRWKQK
jgi:hypothetical protein